MGLALGIDLGTTTSAISILKNGKAEIIPNIEGERLTYSVIAQDENGEIVVGSIAKRKLGESIREVKRLMGTTKTITLGDKGYLPEEASAEILKKIKLDTEYFLGETISEVVITVPALFNNVQKAATIKAGQLAGLNVTRIINEPTAAALYYGLENMGEKNKILVYDFGGGTFDVSILDFEDGILDVLSGSGDNHLGGKNIDEIIMRFIANKNNLKIINGTKEEHLLKNASEQAKIDLSILKKAEILIPQLNIDMEITKEEYQNLIEDVVNRTFYYIEEALKSAKLSLEDIDVVLPVGGTTRIPYIKERLISLFGDKVKVFSNPQEVVALGASVQAGILYNHISSEDGILITDICNYSLGVSCLGVYQGILMDGIFSQIIPKHSSLPCSKKNYYYTTSDNQEEVMVEVYQGESELVGENIKIGEFSSPKIPNNDAGKEAIGITFEYNLNGILEVEVEVVSTGEKKKADYGISLTNSQNNVKISGYKNSIYYSDYKTIIDLAEDKIKKITGTNKIKVEALLDDMKQSLMNEDKEKLDKIDSAITDLLFEV